MATLHLMTQRDQPYGSERRCCERCGLMMISRPAAFWNDNAYVDEERHFQNQKHADGRNFVRCDKPQPSTSGFIQSVPQPSKLVWDIDAARDGGAK